MLPLVAIPKSPLGEVSALSHFPFPAFLLSPGDKVVAASSNKVYELENVGILFPERVPTGALCAIPSPALSLWRQSGSKSAVITNI